MGLLWLVTVGWAFSFSLIGVYLSGQVDDYLSVLIRTLLASVLFIPLIARHWPGFRVAVKLMAIGGIQIGLMYLFFFHSFGYLSVPEVLLFTTLTPLYVTLFDELLERRLHLPTRWWLATVLAVMGAVVIRWDGIHAGAFLGFVLVQGANMCFALGQVLYKRMDLGSVPDQIRDFGFFFFGGAVVALIAAALMADWSKMPEGPVQWGVLLWLGLGASGLGYLGWNSGTRLVNTAQLAVMNNMLIPAGILVNVAIWNRDADWIRLSLGGLILIGAIVIASRSGQALKKS